jgi:hypothetical protein
MPTITVSGIDQKNAPSPIRLHSWQQDWGGQLANLTPWVANGHTYTCTTTTAPATAVENIVKDDLNSWCPDAGKCYWAVS